MIDDLHLPMASYKPQSGPHEVCTTIYVSLFLHDPVLLFAVFKAAS